MRIWGGRQVTRLIKLLFQSLLTIINDTFKCCLSPINVVTTVLVILGNMFTLNKKQMVTAGL